LAADKTHEGLSYIYFHSFNTKSVTNRYLSGCLEGRKVLQPCLQQIWMSWHWGYRLFLY